MSTVRRVLATLAVSAVALAGCTDSTKSEKSDKSDNPTAEAQAAEQPDVDPDASEQPEDAPEEEPPAAAPARKALDAHRGDVKAAGNDAFAFYSFRPDAGGGRHVRYTRSYRGLPVYGGDVIVHTDAAGEYKGVSNSLVKPLEVNTVPAVTAADALAAARGRFAGTISSVGASRLLVDASSGVGRLAWEHTLTGMAKDGQTPSRLHVVTDAHSGAVLGAWDEIETAAGTGHSMYSGQVSIETQRFGTTFRLTDTAHGRGTTCDMQHQTSGSCKPITDDDNVWGNGSPADPQTAAVDAHYGAAKTWDYYHTMFGRRGIFDNGRGVPSRVHYGDNYANAFWDGKQMTYGDGAGNVHPLIGLDVAAHEMTHGVTEKSVPGGLTYAGESGGLNEATSDIFGAMVEFYAANPADPADYLIAERVDMNGNGTPLRYMHDPALDGHSHSCWSAATRDVDVHYSSGVANHFFFNLAEGTGRTAYGTSPVCGSAPGTQGIGREKAARIWYRALDVYFTSNTSYVNAENPGNTARAYTLSATADLYGACGAEYRAVQAAWTAVNVAGADPVCAG